MELQRQAGSLFFRPLMLPGGKYCQIQGIGVPLNVCSKRTSANACCHPPQDPLRLTIYQVLPFPTSWATDCNKFTNLCKLCHMSLRKYIAINLHTAYYLSYTKISISLPKRQIILIVSWKICIISLVSVKSCSLSRNYACLLFQCLC